MTARYVKSGRGRAVVLKQGKFIRFLRKDNWEFCQRANCTGIVVVLAVTDEERLLLIEQFRIPLDRKVVEFPAGLMNDHNRKKKESVAAAARRELLEETGYQAHHIEKILSGPDATGSCADIITFVSARGLRKVAAGGGDETESIVVHEVPLAGVDAWLLKKRRRGYWVDPKIYAGLYFLRKYNVGN